jgi:hypothetical protein
MKAFPLLLFLLLAGCETSQRVAKIFEPDPNKPKPPPPHLDPTRRDWWDRSIRPHDGLHAYHVQVEISDPGSRIEINDEHVGTLTNTLGEIIVWGDNIGRWRKSENVIIANPVRPGQHQQRKIFHRDEDIPRRLYFDLKLVPPPAPPDSGNKNVNINVNH